MGGAGQNMGIVSPNRQTQRNSMINIKIDNQTIYITDPDY
jgi:hypothetical protein